MHVLEQGDWMRYLEKRLERKISIEIDTFIVTLILK